MIGLAATKATIIKFLTVPPLSYNASTSPVTIYNMFVGITAWGPDAVGSIPTYSIVALQPWGIAALVLLILAVALIILYIWLYKRRKNSWKHECKKHLCNTLIINKYFKCFLIYFYKMKIIIILILKILYHLLCYKIFVVKIILKDKLEKELAEKFVTLQTDIQNDAIPTCVCEKSIADKVEKGCLRCVGVFGGGVMPGFGTIGGTALYALNQLKPAVFKAAIKAALEEGAAEILAAGIEAGDAAGMNVVRYGLRYLHVHELFPVIFDSFVKTRPYNEITSIANSILLKYGPTCTGLDNNSPPAACTKFQLNLGIHKKIGAMIDTHGTPASTAIRQGLEGILEEATQTAEAAAKIAEKGVAAEITARETALIEAGFNSSITSINASIFAIVVIVLIKNF
ncbi:hypothetical protein PFNF54_00607 [Plasmodium falciparum NF54]|uniref:Rifin n=1 Tax=Plasmodium falciparum (isolate NF54) TaxID=5843 RepID=W7KC54_PLAFO|nr:hypothetical protein PFNF54_00607 [Plasmodium falciparum NF54]